MRIIDLYFSHFPLQVELSADLELAGKPVIIGGYPHERKTVFDASPEAYACGVQIGMSLRQAHGLCPQAEFLPLDQQRYQQEFEKVLDLLADYTSKLEALELGEVFLELSQDCWEADLIAQIRQEVTRQTGFSVAVGSSRSRFPAQVASRVARTDEVIAVPSGGERAFLKGLPVDLLPISEPVLRRLEMLGIRRMGQLAVLPCQEVGLQFGSEGERLWRLARGIDSSKVIPRKEIPVLADQLEFEPSAETLDRLLAGSQILMNRLSVQLDDRWQHCRGIRVRLYFQEDTLEIIIDFKLATSSPGDMLRHLKHRLENARFSGPVSKIEIAAENLCVEQSTQLKLLDNLPRCSENLAKAIRQLQTKYGKSIIKKTVRPKTFSRLPEGACCLVDFG